ncbi:tetratricopeptide repeat protein [Rhizobacter sp. Root1221]|uniref:tetratricopeptide repeat protein n=1 Tax=Rhizobacter sp. Root1221 TaxID=1736433 RepID=UPI0006F74C5E|nr:tetratricopeptide repeat protein [Rhizobacter sp. Root1221]KQV92862.1 hypothetical protein ASC87_27285 [Rhizobacter sp. Root1221]
MTNPTATQRLDRLEGYLQQDPENLALVGESFDAALQAGAWLRAETHLRKAQALAGHAPGWTLKEGQWLLAQHRFGEARAVLQVLSDAPDVPDDLRPVVAHDLAYIALREGAPESGLAVLAPWVEVTPSQAVDGALQVLWLRLMHRAQRLDAAMAWARERWQVRQLATAAAGVASLVALDESDFTASLLWSDHALKEPGAPVEALVARASVALAEQAPALSRQLLQHALRLNPTDGRTWSALAFTDLMEQQLDAARASFAKALQAMPEHVGTWHGLGWTCLSQGDTDAALRAFEQAIELDRNFAESHGGLAVVLAMRKANDAAQEAIDRAIRLDGTSLSARYAQALLSGDASDSRSLRRLATRLLGGRAAPLGGSMLDLLPQVDDGTPAAPPPGDLN